MFEPKLPPSIDGINLASPRFWIKPADEREGALELLRRERRVSFHAEFPEDGLPAGPGFWALSHHADIVEVSRNPEVWSSSPTSTIHDFPPELEPYFDTMVNMDDPRHTRLRRIVSRGFTPAELGKLEHAISRRATLIINAVIEKGECDFVDDISGPLPLLVICDMMGIPESDAAFVFEQTNIVMSGVVPPDTPPGASPLDIEVRALEALSEFMMKIARERLRNPQDDLTSQLVHADIDGEALSERELASFFILLILAGSETTRHALSHGIQALCDYPEERRKWANDFEGLAPIAVEEVLRWASPVRSFRRTATRDSEIGGQAIAKGEKVVLWYCSANRDSAVFEAPYRFDITRSPNEHVAFGGPGAHYCLGANLARREITILFRELFHRLPDLQIAAKPERFQTRFMDGIRRMPCSFTPGRA